MPITAELTKIRGGKKKFTVVVSDGDRTATIYFGDSKYLDYTKHKDPIRLKRYLKRHASNEDWSDPFTAAFWAKKSTLEQAHDPGQYQRHCK